MKPKRSDLAGFSASEFKTMLRRRGYRVPRTFYRDGSVTKKGDRLYRFRYWSDEFVVDISCPLDDFDRWANSVEKRLTISEWLTMNDIPVKL